MFCNYSVRSAPYALFQSFADSGKVHTTVSRLMLPENNTTLLEKIIIETSSFNASNGWLNRLKKRCGVRILQISGEKIYRRNLN